MKQLGATAPRVAALVEYEDRAILANEVKIRVRFGAPKHGTEVVDFRAASPFIDEDFNGEWQMFTPRPADAPRGIEFGKFHFGQRLDRGSFFLHTVIVVSEACVIQALDDAVQRTLEVRRRGQNIRSIQDRRRMFPGISYTCYTTRNCYIC